MLRFDGKPSIKVQEVSLTQVCAKMRKLLIVMAKQKSCTKNRLISLFYLQLTATKNARSVAQSLLEKFERKEFVQIRKYRGVTKDGISAKSKVLC